jgi:FtsH-binding integral membrane protein
MRKTLGPVETLRQIVAPVNWQVIGWISTAIVLAFICYHLATLPRRKLVSTQNKVIKYIVSLICWAFLLHVVVTDFILKEGILWVHIMIIGGLALFVGIMVRRMAVSLLKYEPIINAILITGILFGVLDLFARDMAAYAWAGVSGCFGGVIGGGLWATVELYRREPTDHDGDQKKPNDDRTKWQVSEKL